MAFATPAWFFALLLLPVVAALEAWFTRRDRQRLAVLVSRPLWGRVVRRESEAWRYVRLALVLVGVAGLSLALARPQWGIVREKIEREGVDVVLALDCSASMLTEDVTPSRFFLARSALAALVTRLDGDRLALLVFEGEAYPLVPLTLDADAIGVFLETLEPGSVPSPGTSLGTGLARGLDLFVDKERRNKVLVLVSDGEDLEGDVEQAIARAKELGVVVHAVAVGTEQGQPVPDLDAEGRRTGFKKAEDGSVVVSRLNLRTLEDVARATGGSVHRLAPQDVSLSALAGTIEGMEQKSMAREFSYRMKERYQLPLAVALSSLTAAFVLPWRRARGALTLALLLLCARGSVAQEGRALDEVLLRPQRATAAGRKAYGSGSHPEALKAFEAARERRPGDPRTAFNLGDALYKGGRYDDAEAVFRALGSDVRSPLAPAARFNLGNTLYAKQDYRGAVGAYRDALRLAPEDEATRRNLELALRALKAQQEEQKRQQGGQQDQRDEQQKQQKQQQQEQQQKQPQGQPPRPNPTPQPSREEQERQRFQKEAGMPKERAMQLLDALQRNEKDEQRKLLAAKRAEKKGGRDW